MPVRPRRLLLPLQPRPICPRCLSAPPIRPLLIRHASTSSNDVPPSPRPSLSKRTAEYLDTLQVRALAASQRLNDITGYTSIESIKIQIHEQGPPLKQPLELILESKARAARAAVTKAKEEYSTAVTTRAETQRELTNLLNRKTSWTPDDLARFTTLYPSDHENEHRAVRTAEELSRAERESEEASADLGRLILSRY
jgi:sensitive to high expression protein 9, mitochondrial